MTRVVIDPSVFVSALIGKPGSAPDIVVRAFIDETIEVLVSPLLVAELERVLLASGGRPSRCSPSHRARGA